MRSADAYKYIYLQCYYAGAKVLRKTPMREATLGKEVTGLIATFEKYF